MVIAVVDGGFVIRQLCIKASAALRLVVAGTSPTEAARQLGLGRATVYREMALAGVRRAAA